MLNMSSIIILYNCL